MHAPRFITRLGPTGWICFALGVAGCAPSLTRSQQIVYTAWDECTRERRIDSNLLLERVDPDGRYWVRVLGGQAGREEANRCMSEKLSHGRWQ